MIISLSAFAVVDFLVSFFASAVNSAAVPFAPVRVAAAAAVEAVVVELSGLDDDDGNFRRDDDVSAIV